MFTLLFMFILFAINLLMCSSSGNALEKAGGREFLDGVKELRKAQAPLEVASGRRLHFSTRHVTSLSSGKSSVDVDEA